MNPPAKPTEPKTLKNKPAPAKNQVTPVKASVSQKPTASPTPKKASAKKVDDTQSAKKLTAKKESSKAQTSKTKKTAETLAIELSNVQSTEATITKTAPVLSVQKDETQENPEIFAINNTAPSTHPSLLVELQKAEILPQISLPAETHTKVATKKLPSYSFRSLGIHPKAGYLLNHIEHQPPVPILSDAFSEIFRNSDAFVTLDGLDKKYQFAFIVILNAIFQSLESVNDDGSSLKVLIIVSKPHMKDTLHAKLLEYLKLVFASVSNNADESAFPKDIENLVRDVIMIETLRDVLSKKDFFTKEKLGLTIFFQFCRIESLKPENQSFKDAFQIEGIKNSQLVLLAEVNSKFTQSFLFSHENKIKIFDSTTRSETTNHIPQIGYATPAEEKFQVLHGYLQKNKPSLSLVYVNTPVVGEWLSYKLSKNGYKVAAITEDLNASDKLKLLQENSQKNVSVVVATDILAQNFAADGLSHVINFDVPENSDTYFQRINKDTGNRNQSISTVTLICEDYGFHMKNIENSNPNVIKIQPVEKEFFSFQDFSDSPLDDQGRVKFFPSILHPEKPKKSEAKLEIKDPEIVKDADFAAPKKLAQISQTAAFGPKAPARIADTLAAQPDNTEKKLPKLNTMPQGPSVENQNREQKPQQHIKTATPAQTPLSESKHQKVPRDQSEFRHSRNPDPLTKTEDSAKQPKQAFNDFNATKPFRADDRSKEAMEGLLSAARTAADLRLRQEKEQEEISKYGKPSRISKIGALVSEFQGKLIDELEAAVTESVGRFFNSLRKVKK